MNILDLEMEENDAKAQTIRDYLKKLLIELWVREEGFSGKRPFGNSGWKHDIYRTLVLNNVVSGSITEYDDCIDIDIPRESMKEADKLIEEAISNMN
jgi:hypothetical protein